MSALLKGVLLGLSLSVLAGPLLFLYLQVGIERGFRAGAMLGLGSWISDFMYLIGAYFGVSYLLELAAWPNFRFYVGLVGGCFLVALGLLLILARTPPPSTPNAQPLFGQGYLGLAIKGFIINTFNPFAAFFWLGVASTTSASHGVGKVEVKYLLGGILVTIIATDIIKILLAKRLRTWFTPDHILVMRRVAGGGLVLLGAALLFRAALPLA